MKNLGNYLGTFKDWIKEGWKFLFEDTEKVQAHHLMAFLISIVIMYLLSYIISKIFTMLLKLFALIAVGWLLYMLLFDRTKYNQLFSNTSGTITMAVQNTTVNEKLLYQKISKVTYPPH